MAAFIRASCAQYLFNSPVQCSCGDRLCGACYENYSARQVSSVQAGSIAA